MRKGNEAIERVALDWNRQGKRGRGTARHGGRRSVHSEGLENGKSWSEEDGQKYEQMAMFVDVLCPEGEQELMVMMIYNKTSIKKNILTVKYNTSGSRSG